MKVSKASLIFSDEDALGEKFECKWLYDRNKAKCMASVDKELLGVGTIRTAWAPGLWVSTKNLRTEKRMYLQGVRQLVYLKNGINSVWKVGETHRMFVGFTHGNSANLSGLSTHVDLKLTDKLPNFDEAMSFSNSLIGRTVQSGTFLCIALVSLIGCVMCCIFSFKSSKQSKQCTSTVQPASASAIKIQSQGFTLEQKKNEVKPEPANKEKVVDDETARPFNIISNEVDLSEFEFKGKEVDCLTTNGGSNKDSS